MTGRVKDWQESKGGISVRLGFGVKDGVTEGVRRGIRDDIREGSGAGA